MLEGQLDRRGGAVSMITGFWEGIYRVKGLRFRNWGLGFRVWGLGFREVQVSFNFMLEKGMEEIMGNKMEAGGFIGRKCLSMDVYIYI